jgi:hypothetical protein
MKYFIAAILTLVLPLTFIFSSPVYAQVELFDEVCQRDSNGNLPADAPTVCRSVAESEGTNPIYGQDGILTRVISILSLVVGIIATIVLIIAGIKMVLSQGDPGKIASARNQIIYALVGVAIAVVSQGLVFFVLNNF